MGQVDTGRAGRRDRRTEHRRSRSLPAVLLAALAAVLVACGPVTAPTAPSSASASTSTAAPTSSSPSAGPTAAEVAAAVEPGLETSPGTVSAEFRDLATGEVLYARDADEPVAPASSLKVLAAAAIVSALGPETTLQTTVVAQPTADGAATELVLVGGGDVLLGTGASDSKHVSGRAGLRTLAERTVAGLVEDGVTGQVVVSTDLRLFADRTALNPRWTSDIPESGNIAPVQPLATYGGREAPGTGEDRIEAPAQFAALTFQAALDDAVAASGADLEVGLRDTIPATEVPRATVLAAAPVAAVESASVGEQVAYLLAHSENQVVEALAHTAAPAADLPATHEGATQLLTATAEDLGVDTAGMALVDSSGLSPDNRVSAGQLAGVVAGVARTPALGTVLEGLPRPGEDSTLGDRFPDAPARQAVAAKTGTLDQTVSLTGTVTTTSGRVLAFSIICSDLQWKLEPARAAVDEAVSAVAGL